MIILTYQKCHSLSISASELKLVSFLLKQILLELEWNSVLHHMYTVSKDNLLEASLNIKNNLAFNTNSFFGIQ